MSKKNIALLASLVFCLILLIGHSEADANAYSNADANAYSPTNGYRYPVDPCQERPVVHVATDGTDHQDCGSAGDPCRSLRQGQVHENHASLEYVKAHVAMQRGDDQTSREGSCEERQGVEQSIHGLSPVTSVFS